MELRFPITKVIPKKDLQQKLSNLELDPTVDRIFVGFDILDDKNEIILSSNAIFDTGAPFSLLPASLLEEFNELQTIPHTIHGILDTEECQIEASLAKINIQFKDRYGNHSSPVQILVAFSSQENVPYLIGMKGILSQSHISILIDSETFILNIK